MSKPYKVLVLKVSDHQCWGSRSIMLVMLEMVASILFGWWNWVGKHASDVWKLVLACQMWLAWKEQNIRAFEDVAKSTDQLRPL